MTSILLQRLTQEWTFSGDDCEEWFITSDVSWQQYDMLLMKLGDRYRYRITYLDTILAIMSPSRRHERLKTNIGMLLEAYFQETGTRFFGLGSTTLRQEDKNSGIEADECYCFDVEKEFPDLAIEVVLTSGGVNKLSVYQRLGIKEVWFWQNDQLEVYCLAETEYHRVTQSKLLPNLDLTMFAEYIVKSDPLEAVLEFRKRITLALGDSEK